MKKENVVLMAEAREALAGKWLFVAGVYALYFIIAIVISHPDKVGSILGLIIAGPFAVGLAKFSLSLARKQEAEVSQLFEGFKDFKRAFFAYILVTVFILLWSLLLIIPGIIASLSYSLTFFIIAEDKSISPRDAIKKSKAMMDGNKEKLFYLYLRFLGWAVLCILTFGIGVIFFWPYLQVTMAKFYEDVSSSTPSPVQS